MKTLLLFPLLRLLAFTALLSSALVVEEGASSLPDEIAQALICGDPDCSSASG